MFDLDVSLARYVWLPPQQIPGPLETFTFTRGTPRSEVKAGSNGGFTTNEDQVDMPHSERKERHVLITEAVQQ